MYSIVAFATGAAVMIAEIAAARLIAPHFGTSIVVWTNIIGIILIALSVGYWIGGRTAERAPEPRVLGGIIAFAGLLLCIPAFATRLVAGVVLGDVLRFGSGFLLLAVGSFLSVVLLFALPIALLGMVSPFLVKITTRDRTDIGAIAGRLYAVSTLGSLVGTFLPTLILLPTFGARRTILAAAAVLLVTGAALLPRRRAIAIGSAVLVLVLVLVPESPPPWMFGGAVVAAAESRYQYLRVVDRDDARGTNVRSLLFNEGFGTQSVAVRATLPEGYFTRMAELVALVPEDPVDVVILGNAGGTIGHAMELVFPERDLRITGVELDPAVTAITREYFTPPPKPYPITHADSRVFVREGSTRYDVIVVDAYTNQLTIPSHLATEEFFDDLRTRLAPGGFVAMNVNAPTRDSRLLGTLLQTIAAVFPETIVGHSGSGWNWIVLGSESPLSFADLPDTSERPRIAWVHVDRDDAERTFTDDWAPLELFTDFEIFNGYRSAAVR